LDISWYRKVAIGYSHKIAKSGAANGVRLLNEIMDKEME